MTVGLHTLALVLGVLYLDTDSTSPQSLGTQTDPFKALSELLAAIPANSSGQGYISGRSLFLGELFSNENMGGWEFYGDWIPGTPSDRYRDRLPGHRAKFFDAQLLSGYSWTDEGGGVFSAALLGRDLDVYWNLYGLAFNRPFAGSGVTTGSGYWLDNGDGTYTSIHLAPEGQTPGVNQWAPAAYDGSATRIYMNVGGVSPETKSILAANIPRYQGGSCSGNTLENWSPGGTAFFGFEVWFGFIGIGNTGCLNGYFADIDIYYPALAGIRPTQSIDVFNVSVHNSGGLGYYMVLNTTPPALFPDVAFAGYSSNVIVNRSRWIGIIVEDGAGILANARNNLYNATVFGSGDDGVYVRYSGIVHDKPQTIKNVISTNNAGQSFTLDPSAAGDLVASNNCTGGGGYGGAWAAYKGAGNVERDCDLGSPSSGNFYPQPSSPLIDAGAAIASRVCDYAGTLVPQGATCDIGAYEFIVGADISAPAVTITSPGSGTIYTSPQTVNLLASAADNVGVTKVEFYDGSTLKGTDASTKI